MHVVATTRAGIQCDILSREYVEPPTWCWMHMTDGILWVLLACASL